MWLQWLQRAHASIDDRIFEVASRVLREAASAPITEINGLTRGFNVAHGLNSVLPFQAAEALTIPVGGISFFVLLSGTDITRHCSHVGLRLFAAVGTSSSTLASAVGLCLITAL